MYGRFDLAKLLVEHGADIHKKGNYGRSPLHYAATSKEGAKLVQWLIDKGVDVNSKNSAGDNPLFELISSKRGSAEACKILITNGIDLNAKTNGQPILHWAAFCGASKVLEALLDSGLDINTKDKYGYTPLLSAMSQHKMETIEFLIKKGADVNIMPKSGFNVLEFAADHKKVALAKMIFKKRTDQTTTSGALSAAAERGSLGLIKFFLKAGISVDDRTYTSSKTALMKAASSNQLKVVKYLLEQGADLKATAYQGNTTLIYAAAEGHLAIVQLLLEHGADINEQNKIGWTALMQASTKNRYKVVKLLLEKGAQTTAIDKEFRLTALGLAKENNHTEIIEILEKHGAKDTPPPKKQKGFTSLVDCNICTHLEQQKSYHHTSKLLPFPDLKLLHKKGKFDSYGYGDVHRVLQCPNCSTLYYNYHSIYEWDFQPPSITNDFQRVELSRSKPMLQELNCTQKAEKLEANYPNIIAQFQTRIETNWITIDTKHLNYVIAALTDHFIEKNDWKGLEKCLLNHADQNIVFNTIRDLIYLYKQGIDKGLYPNFRNYRMVSAQKEEQVRKFIRKRLKPIKQYLELMKISKHPYWEQQYEYLSKTLRSRKKR
ncbi:MAG: hypothetical protein GY810_05460 [Aureispira sp.]|nr:hypothetical protein [Aureispira sp.]